MPTTKDKTRLEDLEVQEVSVVDRPANQRRFLIVKRQEENEMPRNARPADDKSIHKGADDDGALALLLDLDNLDSAEDDPPEVDDQGGGEDDAEFAQIFKAANAGAALKVTQTALQKLMGAVKAIKGLGDKPPGPPIASVLRGVSAALNLMAGGEKAEAEKAGAGDALKAVTAAVTRLMALVTKLKAMDASAEVPSDVMSEARTIAAAIAGAMGSGEAEEGAEDDKGADKKKTTKMEIFVAKDADDEDEDPEIIIKAGAKMKRTRLSKLKQAVTLLTEVLKEIAPEDKEDEKDKKGKKGDKDKDKKKGKVNKVDDSTMEAAIASVAATVETLGEKVKEIGKTVTDSLSEVTKRVKTLEGEPPAPTETDDDATPVKKKDEPGQSLFHNVVNQ